MLIIPRVFLVSFLLSLGALGAAPLFETTPVFSITKDNKPNYRIPRLTRTAVRYAWATNPKCNLVNAAGLPASPFRTDDW